MQHPKTSFLLFILFPSLVIGIFIQCQVSETEPNFIEISEGYNLTDIDSVIIYGKTEKLDSIHLYKWHSKTNTPFPKKISHDALLGTTFSVIFLEYKGPNISEIITVDINNGTVKTPKKTIPNLVNLNQGTIAAEILNGKGSLSNKTLLTNNGLILPLDSLISFKVLPDAGFVIDTVTFNYNHELNNFNQSDSLVMLGKIIDGLKIQIKLSQIENQEKRFITFKTSGMGQIQEELSNSALEISKFDTKIIKIAPYKGWVLDSVFISKPHLVTVQGNQLTLRPSPENIYIHLFFKELDPPKIMIGTFSDTLIHLGSSITIYPILSNDSNLLYEWKKYTHSDSSIVSNMKTLEINAFSIQDTGNYQLHLRLKGDSANTITSNIFRIAPFPSFKIDSFNIDLQIMGPGKTNYIKGNNRLVAGEKVHFKILPDDSAKIDSILINGINDTNTINNSIFSQDSLDKDYSIKIKFVLKSYEITIASIDSSLGTVSIKPPKKHFLHNEKFELIAIPKEKNHFSGWQNIPSDSSLSQTFYAKTDLNLIGLFSKPDEFSLFVTGNDGNSIIVDPQKTSYILGSSVTLTPKTLDGWKFISWSGDLSGQEVPKTLTINKTHKVNANFERVNVLANIKTIPTNVTQPIIPKPIYWGLPTDLNANTPIGYEFIKWQADENSSKIKFGDFKSAQTTLIVEDSTAIITAEFKKKTFNINAIVTGNGTTKPPTPFTKLFGESLHLELIPKPGNYLKSVLINNSPDQKSLATNSISTNELKQPINAIIVFAKSQYSISITSTEGGIASGARSDALYNTAYSLIAEPDNYKKFSKWTVLSGTENILQFDSTIAKSQIYVSGNANVKAIFTDAPQLPEPNFSLPPGDYIGNQSLILSMPEAYKNAQIFYTKDGKEPSQSSKPYLAEILLEDEIANIKAVAYLPGYRPSTIKSNVYGVTQVNPPKGLRISVKNSNSVWAKWNKSPQTSHYKIYYNKGNSVEQSSSFKVTSDTSIFITGLANKNKYAFAISAVIGKSESNLSSTITRSINPYGVIIGSSLAQAIATYDIDYPWNDYRMIEDSTNFTWNNLFIAGTESACMWARLSNFVDSVTNFSKDAPAYILLVSRHVFWTLSKARVTVGQSKYIQKTTDLINQHKTNPDSIQSYFDSIIASGPILNTDISNKGASAYPGIFSIAHRDWWDFPNILNKSFLPKMIEDSKKIGAELILLNYKTLLNVDSTLFNATPEMPQIYHKYITDIKAYSKKNQVRFIDMGEDNLIKIEDFKNQGTDDHITNGQLFNSIVSQNIKAIVNGTPPPLEK